MTRSSLIRASVYVLSLTISPTICRGEAAQDIPIESLDVEAVKLAAEIIPTASTSSILRGPWTLLFSDFDVVDLPAEWHGQCRAFSASLLGELVSIPASRIKIRDARSSGFAAPKGSNSSGLKAIEPAGAVAVFSGHAINSGENMVIRSVLRDSRSRRVFGAWKTVLVPSRSRKRDGRASVTRTPTAPSGFETGGGVYLQSGIGWVAELKMPWPGHEKFYLGFDTGYINNTDAITSELEATGTDLSLESRHSLTTNFVRLKSGLRFDARRIRTYTSRFGVNPRFVFIGGGISLSKAKETTTLFRAKNFALTPNIQSESSSSVTWQMAPVVEAGIDLKITRRISGLIAVEYTPILNRIGAGDLGAGGLAGRFSLGYRFLP